LRYVVGIDAGGSKTVGLLADEAGEVRAAARAGGANLQVQGELGVEKVLYEVIARLEPPGPIAAVCLGMAGVDRPGERELLHGVLRRLGLYWTARIRIENDAFIALVAGAPERLGIVVVAGTGSVAYGVDGEGRTARSGGWGYLLGDEGSAYWLGHAALRRAIRAADGRDEPTSLVDRLARRLDLEVPAGLVSWFYDQEHFRFRGGGFLHQRATGPRASSSSTPPSTWRGRRGRSPGGSRFPATSRWSCPAALSAPAPASASACGRRSSCRGRGSRCSTASPPRAP